MNSLTHRKLRSWLTVIGIIIGVASVVALISIGEGATARITSQLSGLGADIITISPGHQRAGRSVAGFGGEFGGFGGSRTTGNLTEDDVRIVRTTQGILYVNGIVSDRGDVSYLGQTSSVSIQGVDTSVWRFMETTKISSGRYLNSGDTGVVVIGNRIATTMFTQTISINKLITIEGRQFKVVGILEAGTGMSQQDNIVYMSKEDARQLFDLDSKKVDSITAKVADASQVEIIANKTEEKLRITRHAQGDKQDFTVSTSVAMQNQISSISGTLTLFLGAIAGISLLVGAIGISNTMFTSVMERTKHIGILKSIGATKSEITKIFITEAALLGLFGGIIGAFVGILASGMITLLSTGSLIGAGGGAQGGFTTIITPNLVIFSILFSTVIGAIAGYFPAKRAANMQPVEALRYE